MGTFRGCRPIFICTVFKEVYPSGYFSYIIIGTGWLHYVYSDAVRPNLTNTHDERAFPWEWYSKTHDGYRPFVSFLSSKSLESSVLGASKWNDFRGMNLLLVLYHLHLLLIRLSYIPTLPLCLDYFVNTLELKCERLLVLLIISNTSPNSQKHEYRRYKK